MAQNPIEVILARQLASHLAMPMFIVDPAGDLLFYNEPAEAILGRRFEEGGWMNSGEWSNTFQPVDEDGQVVELKGTARAACADQSAPGSPPHVDHQP